MEMMRVQIHEERSALMIPRASTGWQGLPPHARRVRRGRRVALERQGRASRFVWSFSMEIICMGFYYGFMKSDQRL